MNTIKNCKKENCGNLCFNNRFKYCEEHQSRKRKCIEENILWIEREYAKEDKEKRLKELEEERILKQEQETEYELTKFQDLKLREEKELEKAILESEILFIEEKKKEIEIEPEYEEDSFKLKFKLPNGKTITRTFYSGTQLKHIRSYLKIYFYANKIPIEKYSLVLNFPKKEFTELENEMLLSDLVSEKNILFYIKTLD